MALRRDEIAEAARLIRSGETVVFPTETVYGLGADALNPDAVALIFQVKCRPADNPLIVHLADVDGLDLVAGEPDIVAHHLLSAFAPGPLTVVVPAGPELPRIVTAGLDTVAVRIPRHPVAHELLVQSGCPVAAPSANRSGEPSPTTLAMARRSLGDRPSAYLDGGPCDVGLESTVALVRDRTVTILRPGAVSAADIRRELTDVEVRSAGDMTIEAAASPGTRHRHYQPRAEVILFEILDELDRWLVADAGGEVGVICSRATANALDDRAAQTGRPEKSHLAGHHLRVYDDIDEYARWLYAWLHEFDDIGVSTVVAQYPDAEGIGDALRDRLERSSGRRFIDRL
jgi:L-threonylcarbamoyladenylate synthase